MTLRWDTRNRVGSAVSDWTGRQFLVEYLVVAGGGGGGAVGAGGGAGGYRVGALPVTTGTSYTITVGAGGAGGAVGSSGSNGSDSVFSTITSTGGGRGGSYNGGNGSSGGSGGGGAGGAAVVWTPGPGLVNSISGVMLHMRQVAAARNL